MRVARIGETGFVGSSIDAADAFQARHFIHDQLSMLLAGNSCDAEKLRSPGVQPKAFDLENLAYLNSRLTQRSMGSAV